MVSFGTKCFHLGLNVIIWDEMSSSGTKCYHLVVVVVGLHPMTQVGSLRKCLDPDVVPPLAGFLLVAVLGILHHILSVVSVCVFETAHCFRSFYVSRDWVPGLHNSV